MNQRNLYFNSIALFLRNCLAFLLVGLCLEVSGQSTPYTYTTANAHSHNDYEQPHPFWNAWQQQFGSIEADIFLNNDRLIVAHDRKEMALRRTLDSMYLQPLQQCIKQNSGYPYADKKRMLQLMIDIKTEAEPTLQKLVEVLKKYPSLIHSSSIIITISGNRPVPESYSRYPKWIWFDGDIGKTYNQRALAKIPMLSGNFANFVKWNGTDSLSAADKEKIQHLISEVHHQGKKIRFWNAPDLPNSWRVFINLGVDYINTDHIDELSGFLK
ncbi:MAG TPA: phosphatidylinositol-specific phospholipase C/glycerophosphodiester phosphodiesterase family protein [Flavisolibacter sp.]|nr:phosphatidylinositol-specific phospholipase C/glycerophosphodiester phosphodiesterase family protein [Flavisolibacter sp.]